jgi:hypothetical protein
MKELALDKYDPSQPRDPQGSETGGQWTGHQETMAGLGELTPRPERRRQPETNAQHQARHAREEAKGASQPSLTTKDMVVERLEPAEHRTKAQEISNLYPRDKKLDEFYSEDLAPVPHYAKDEGVEINAAWNNASQDARGGWKEKVVGDVYARIPEDGDKLPWKDEAKKLDQANDLTQHERIEAWLRKVTVTLPPSPLDERLEKALGYTPELYRIFISHGVGRFMAGQINDEYLRGITRGTIEHGLVGAWVDGMEQNGLAYPDDMTDEWNLALGEMIQKEMSYLPGFIHALNLGRERVQAGGSYNAELEQALKRAELWARRYDDIKQRAIRITAASPKARKLARKRGAIRMIWKLGLTEVHCPSCLALNGVVAFEWEWAKSGYFPRIPNEKLECKGFKCDCTCLPTELRRSKALRNGRTLEEWIPERIERVKRLGVAGAKLGAGITKMDANQSEQVYKLAV